MDRMDMVTSSLFRPHKPRRPISLELEQGLAFSAEPLMDVIANERWCAPVGRPGKLLPRLAIANLNRVIRVFENMGHSPVHRYGGDRGKIGVVLRTVLLSPVDVRS